MQFKKSQGLPLNTIVLALLVIIVLVLLIGYFVTGIGKSSDNIEKTEKSVYQCDKSNPLLSIYDEVGKGKSGQDNWKRVPTIENCYYKKNTE